MHTFFEDIRSLNRFTHELDSPADTVECHLCRRGGQLVYRKVQVNELAEAIHEVLPSLRFNKSGVIPKIALYRKLLAGKFLCPHATVPDVLLPHAAGAQGPALDAGRVTEA